MKPLAEFRAAIFVDDGGPDAAEFSSNYVWFDRDDPEDTQRAWDETHRLYEERCRSVDPNDPYGELAKPRLCPAPPFAGAA